MSRNPTSFSLLGALICLAGAPARGQSPAPAPADSSPVFTAAKPSPPATPPADDDHGDTRRIKSDELAGALASAMPKYDPPKPAKPEADQQDADKPKNGIIRLPKYIVRDAKPPVFTEKDLLTEKGQEDLAMKRYIIDTGSMPWLAAGVSKLLFQANADQQYADAERASDMSSLRNAASAAAAGGDRAESDFIRKASNDTFMRRSDWAPIPAHTATSSTPGENGGGNGQ